MHKCASHVDLGFHRKLGENVEVIIIPIGQIKYLQPFHVEMFYDYKLIVKRSK